MPYITDRDRTDIDKAIAEMPAAMSAGEVAYAIVKVVMNSTLRPSSYTEMATLIGVLETVKSEFQDRLVSPYEAAKWQANGDVF